MLLLRGATPNFKKVWIAEKHLVKAPPEQKRAEKSRSSRPVALELDGALLDGIGLRKVAGAEVARLHLAELRALLGALLARHGAARVEATAGGRVDG